MELNVPTYEEYQRATTFARFRYKYGLIVNLIGILCFIFLIFFMVRYAKEISENPLIYGAKKLDVQCNCFNYETGRNLFVNSTDLIFNKREGVLLG